MELIFIILGIIAALSGFFKDNQDTDTGTPRRGNGRPGPIPFPTGDNSHDETESRQPQSTVVTESIEEQQNEQRKQLAERFNTGKDLQTPEHEHDAITPHNTRETDADLSVEKKKIKKQMNNNLSRTGLINGVIMSEVLGQPRAVKPYRSIISERKK